jgi:hypothetical protein
MPVLSQFGHRRLSIHSSFIGWKCTRTGLRSNPKQATANFKWRVEIGQYQMHQELWERWGRDLPVDAELRHYLLLDRNFNENGAEDLIKEYKATISYAGLLASQGHSSQPRPSRRR